MDFVRNSNPDFLHYTLEESLESFGTNYVDIYFIHWPDSTVSFEEVGKTIKRFVKEGVICNVGLSNFSIEQLEQFKSGGRVDVVQLPYNILSPYIEDDALPFAHQNNIGVMDYLSLFHGILTGTLKKGQTFNEDDFRSKDPRFQGEKFDQLIDTLYELKVVAEKKDATLAQLSLARMMAQNVIPIAGAQYPEHIESSVKAVDIDLTDNEVKQIVEIADSGPKMSLADIALPEHR